MTKKHVAKFIEERRRLNKIVMKYSSDEIKKFYSLDAQVYQEGILSRKIKELMGLVASLVLRCDECITYHIMQCYDNNVTTEELEEALSIGLIVGGSITIPHIRKVFAQWNELQKGEKT